MRLALGVLVVLCSTAVAAPAQRTTARRPVITRPIKAKNKTTSASYHGRKTPMPLRSGF